MQDQSPEVALGVEPVEVSEASPPEPLCPLVLWVCDRRGALKLSNTPPGALAHCPDE